MLALKNAKMFAATEMTFQGHSRSPQIM